LYDVAKTISQAEMIRDLVKMKLQLLLDIRVFVSSVVESKF